MNRRSFIKSIAFAGIGTKIVGCQTADFTDGTSSEAALTAGKFSALKRLPTPMPRATVEKSKLEGKIACKYIDDVIWCLRDLARQRPKSIFDHPFFGGLKRVHVATGMKVQLNLFYRTDFFYGMDEFTLADMPDSYKGEFQANADWIKFGFHSFQEFPDYPWVNADYDDVAKCLKLIHDNVARFAGDNLFARALIPHWVPMSKDGVRALVDGGIKIMYATAGDRFAYGGDPDVLPYGHAFRLLNNRKSETALYTREFYMSALAASICGYNHVDREQNDATRNYKRWVFDPETGMRFRDFCTRPMSCINIHSIPELKGKLDAVKDCEFVGYGNHEQYFFKDYLAYQPEYMEKEMLCARTLADRGYRFIFMEELV